MLTKEHDHARFLMGNPDWYIILDNDCYGIYPRGSECGEFYYDCSPEDLLKAFLDVLEIVWEPA